MAQYDVYPNPSSSAGNDIPLRGGDPERPAGRTAHPHDHYAGRVDVCRQGDQRAVPTCDGQGVTGVRPGRLRGAAPGLAAAKAGKQRAAQASALVAAIGEVFSGV